MASEWTKHFGGPQPVDMKFIRDSWLESYKTSPWAGAVPNNLYRDVYTQAIDQLLARGAKLLCIRNPTNKALLVGWVCFELTHRGEVVIHYAYVKPPYRRNGAAKALINTILAAANQTRFFYTFRTPSSKYLNGTYRPEIARRRDSKPAPALDS
jgi:GNAT superfamily N-acetyltransferase